METTYGHMTASHWEILQRIAGGESLICHPGKYRGGVWMIGSHTYNGHHVNYLTARFLHRVDDRYTLNEAGKTALREMPDAFLYRRDEVVKPITVLRYRVVGKYRPLSSKVEKFRKLLLGHWDDFPTNKQTKDALMSALRCWRQSRPGRGKRKSRN